MTARIYKKFMTVFMLVAGLVLASQTVHALEYRYFFDSNEERILDADLTFLYSIKSSTSSPLHLEVFGGSDGAAYQKFFNSRIKIIRRNNSGNSSYAFSADGYRDTIAVTAKYFEVPQILRIAILLHEARHSDSENSNWNHITCPNPYLDEAGNEIRSLIEGNLPLSGREQVCDTEAKGSYGVAALMFKNIADNCENCDAEVKTQARVLYHDIRNRIVDPAERRKLDR